MTKRKKFQTLHAARIAGLGIALTAGLLVGLLVSTGPARADVFIWTDPADGRTRMSNIAPPWLLQPPEGRAIPKVEVIRGGTVIDPVTALGTPQPPATPSPRQLGIPATDTPAQAPDSSSATAPTIKSGTKTNPGK